MMSFIILKFNCVDYFCVFTFNHTEISSAFFCDGEVGSYSPYHGSKLSQDLRC